MRTPAGRPLSMIKISSPPDSRRWRGRSSFNSESDTAFIGLSRLREPFVCTGLRDDGQYLYGLFQHIIEHAELPHTEPVLRASNAAQPLDARPTDRHRAVSQMSLDGPTKQRAVGRAQAAQVVHGFRREHDLIRHPGQTIAAVSAPGNRRGPPSVPQKIGRTWIA